MYLRLKNTFLKYLHRLASPFLHDKTKRFGYWEGYPPKSTSQEERETRRGADGKTFGVGFCGLTLLVFCALSVVPTCR